MNSCQVFNDLDEVVNCRFLSISRRVLDLHLLGNFGHLVTAKVQKGLDEVTVNKALERSWTMLQTRGGGRIILKRASKGSIPCESIHVFLFN